MKADEKLLTPEQVAGWLGVSADWVQSHATRREPRLNAVRLGKLLRFREQDVEEFIRRRSSTKGMPGNGRIPS